MADQPGPDADVENAAGRRVADTLPERDHLLLAHDLIEQAWKKPAAIEAHLLSPASSSGAIAVPARKSRSSDPIGTIGINLPRYDAEVGKLSGS